MSKRCEQLLQTDGRTDGQRDNERNRVMRCQGWHTRVFKKAKPGNFYCILGFLA